MREASRVIEANPAMRSPNTATIEPPIAKLRLCRVVRGVPKNAKVNAAKAKGVLAA